MDTTEKTEFAICVADEGHDDLEVWKLYRVLLDPKAALGSELVPGHPRIRS